MSYRKRRKPKNVAPPTAIRHLTSNEVSAITFISTIILASVAILEGIKEPVVWAFLGTAIGASIGHIER